MGSPLTVQDLLDRNANNLPAYQSIPTIAEIQASGGALPHIIVITCADPRCIPENFLHLNTGEVLVFRKVGGHAMNTINDIVALDALVTVSDIVVVEHTDCGTTMFKDQGIRDVLKDRAPEHEKEIDEMVFEERKGTIEESVKRSLDYLKASPYLRDELKARIHGFWFDLKSGKLTPVEA
jgi:carbonic anhydrase